MKNQKGFTIVELVVVIVVIGILAAVALPRFLGLQDRAHDAVVEGTQSALASGVVMAKSVWLAEGRDSALDNIISKAIGETCKAGTTGADGSRVCAAYANAASTVGLDVNDKGYPVSHTEYDGVPNDLAEDDDAACAEIFEFLLSENSVKATGVSVSESEGPDSAFEFSAKADTDECTFTYLPDSHDDGRRTITYSAVTGRVTANNLSSTGVTSN